MFKIIYGGFVQETNSFSPGICKLENFKVNVSGQAVIDELADTAMFGGMIQPLLEADDVELIPATVMQAHAYGPVDRAVADMFIERVFKVIREAGKVDGIFLSLHGGMCLTDEDDGIGLLLETFRKEVGDSVIIAASTDLHANITGRVMKNLDILTGYQTYPHIDVYDTSKRAALLGLRCLRGVIAPVSGFVKLPMILQPEGCTTAAGPLRELMDYGLSLADQGEILDFSLYHMQPWLDVKEAGAAVVLIATDQDKAGHYAAEIAQRFFDMREQLSYKLMPLDEVLDIAVRNKSGKPVILSDSADASSAGSGGDSTEVLRRIIERKLDLKASLVVADPVAPSDAERIGFGNRGSLTFGGKIDKKYQRSVTLEGTVTGLFDGKVLVKSGPYEGLICECGKTALFRVGNIDIVICQVPVLNFFPEQFEGFGLNIADYDLLTVKSALAYRALFMKYTSEDRMYTVDTPGASSSNLLSLDFVNIPRPIYPYDILSGYRADKAVITKARCKK